VNTTETRRLDSIRLRICILGSQVRRATEAFDLDPRTANPSMILLYEDLADGFSHPLIDRGVVLRRQLRATNAARHGDDDVTVFVHPFRRRHLTPFWLAFHTRNGETLSVTEDWTGGNKTTEASLVTLRRRSAVWTPSNPGTSGDLLSQSQRRFLAECARIDADTTRFTELGPVIGRNWIFRRNDLDVAAQRWTIPIGDDLAMGDRFDVLELSTQTRAEDAAFVQPAFTALVRRHGLDADTPETPVSYRAVGYLARGFHR